MSALGVGPLPREARTHVAIGPEGTARDGMLFETTGLRFERAEGGVGGEPLALHVAVSVPDGLGRALRDELAPAGGKRRLVRFRKDERAALPSCPEAVAKHVRGEEGEETVRVRVVLMTPGCFEAGALPSDGSPMLAAHEGLTARLVAAAVGRPVTVSGWDFVEGGAKPSRRLAAAGSVYWVELKGSPESRSRWLERVWMQNVSDLEQDRRDGYGLAVVGVAR